MRIFGRTRTMRWGALLAVVALLIGSGLVAFHMTSSAHAQAITGCSGKALATAQSTQSGYTLTVSLIAQFGTGGENGTGYCGSMKTSAIFSVPASGKGGPLTVSLVGSNTGTVSNTYSFPDASPSGGYTFTEYSPSAGPKCAYGTATFTSSTGLVLTATTSSACPK
jgi:hypothetical protein